MPAEKNKDFSRKAKTVVIMVTVTALLVLLIIKAIKVFLLVFAGVIIAAFFRAIAHAISKKTNWPIKATLPISVILVLAFWVGLFFLLQPKVSREADKLSQRIPKAAQKLEGQMRQSGAGRFILQQLPFDLGSPGNAMKQMSKPTGPSANPSSPDSGEEESTSSGTMKNIRKQIINFFSTSFGILGDLYVIMFFGIFFMANPEIYRKGLVMLFPPEKRDRAGTVYDASGVTLKLWLFGKLLSMAVVTTLTIIGLWALGIPLFISLAIIAGLLSFIPNFGPLIAIIPAFLVGVVESPEKGLYVVLLYMTVQAIESNLITPFIMKRQIRVPMAMTLFSQLLLGYLVGGWGLVFATPIMAILMVIIQMVYIEDTLGDNIKVKGEDLALQKTNQS